MDLEPGKFQNKNMMVNHILRDPIRLCSPQLAMYIILYIYIYIVCISYHIIISLELRRIMFHRINNINISSRCPTLPWAKRFHSVPTPCKVQMANPSCPDPFGLKRLLSHSTPAYMWTKMCSTCSTGKIKKKLCGYMHMNLHMYMPQANG